MTATLFSLLAAPVALILIRPSLLGSHSNCAHGALQCGSSARMDWLFGSMTGLACTIILSMTTLAIEGILLVRARVLDGRSTRAAQG